MIYLITNTPKIYNELADMVRMFLSDDQVKLGNDLEIQENETKIIHNHSVNEYGFVENYFIHYNSHITQWTYDYDFHQTNNEMINQRIAKRSSKLGLYNALKKITGKLLPWGALTGIRPTTLYRQINKSEIDSAKAQFENILDVSDEKISLVEEIIDTQKNIYYKGDENSIDIYIGIPFCPTRCTYCSFISHDLSKKQAPLDDYVNCVVKEIDALQNYLKCTNKKIRCVYVGGGTPTSIGHENLNTILCAITKLINKDCELTVEAGRVDTITDDILNVLKANNVNRISINSQSMNDNTLALVNRPHTGQDTLKCLDKAVKYNFDSINMDIIMGLPSENKEDMEHTLSIMKTLPIDNLTIHTLAIKRASKIKMDNLNLTYADTKIVSEMINKGREIAHEMGMKPYYMYRQKYMAGNLENVGYAKEGKQCIYNVDIMEETHNIYAIGAGAISKRMFFAENRHTRYANPKSVEHYIENIDKLIENKKEYFS